MSSLNLINLSEGAPGKCDTEVGVIAEYAGRRGWGVVRGAGTLAWGQAAVLGRSWFWVGLTGPVAPLSRPRPGRWARDQNVTGTEGAEDGRCPGLWGAAVCAPGSDTVGSICGAPVRQGTGGRVGVAGHEGKIEGKWQRGSEFS